MNIGILTRVDLPVRLDANTCKWITESIHTTHANRHVQVSRVLKISMCIKLKSLLFTRECLPLSQYSQLNYFKIFIILIHHSMQSIYPIYRYQYQIKKNKKIKKIYKSASVLPIVHKFEQLLWTGIYVLPELHICWIADTKLQKKISP